MQYSSYHKLKKKYDKKSKGRMKNVQNQIISANTQINKENNLQH